MLGIAWSKYGTQSTQRTRREKLLGVPPQGALRGGALGSRGAAFTVDPLYRPGQRRGAEWPRAEVRLRAGMLPATTGSHALGSSYTAGFSNDGAGRTQEPNALIDK